MGCNPILESFGNAKTKQNDNSSRFGKLVILLIEKQKQKIKGAVITNYLLEKSRIIAQSSNERDYHYFYMLLTQASKEILDSLGLISDPKKYEYVSKSGCYTAPTWNDKECYQEVVEAFQVGFFKILLTII